ncbi:MAG: hypothetical protein A2Z16_12710 [Chloroflexi bacterium RBG_16_54_18]|nr:MAG: hypothetical protein A2Z16_12710 [Chloroflexi bacterium RBG_16_54_18]
MIFSVFSLAAVLPSFSPRAKEFKVLPTRENEAFESPVISRLVPPQLQNVEHLSVALEKPTPPAPNLAKPVHANEVFLPLAFQQSPHLPPGPMENRLFCSQKSFDIPDNDPTGITDQLTISDLGVIVDLDLQLVVDHTWVGDLLFRLTHLETGKSISLIDQPGIPDTQDGCAENDIRTILDDEISISVENKCSPNVAAISGIYLPQEALSTFDADSVAGTWQLSISDHGQADRGSVNRWCLNALINSEPVTPPPPPPPPELPDVSIIQGVNGRAQALPLDCESRSAVDWAAYFGVPIGELNFMNALPVSDNPDAGFVGDPYGTWGQIPPDPYGVHAEPVAELLREYGLPAHAHRPLTWDELRSEIAAGRPVIVWIVGAVGNGAPEYYTALDSHLTVVARYEHTVIVTGYTPDTVYYLNGANIQTRSVVQFLDSWSVMRNMAITTQP